MFVDCAFRPGDVDGDSHWDALVVIDVLRATSVMVTLCAGGAPEVLLARDLDHARALKAELGEGWYVSGARGCRKVPGFDFANAMNDFVELDLTKHRFVLSTTNGTGTIYGCRHRAPRCWVGSLLNLTATARAFLGSLEGDKGRGLVVLSGVGGAYALDDALCAGALLRRIADFAPDLDFSDEARTLFLACAGTADFGRSFRESRTGRILVDAGLESELAFVLDTDRYDLAVEVVDGGPEGTLGLRAVSAS